MQASGFVLAGGASKRMGRDKALLPHGGATLVEHIAKIVKEAAGSVTLIGDSARLAHLDLPVVADDRPGLGPAGGVYTALRVSETDWNLVVACDMPAVTVEALRAILRQAGITGHFEPSLSPHFQPPHIQRFCVAALGSGDEPEPLCAVYHRACLPALARAIQDKRLKMRDFLKEIEAVGVPFDGPALANVNTPDEWAAFQAKLS